MAQGKNIWVISRVEIFPNGDMTLTASAATADSLGRAYEMLDKEIWYWIKEKGFAVKDEYDGLSNSTVILENNSELRRVILNLNKVFLQ